MWVEDLTRQEAHAWNLLAVRQKHDDQIATVSRIGRHYMATLPLAPCHQDFSPLPPLREAPEDETPIGKILREQVNTTLANFLARRP